jgi:hypothetical protein
MWRLAVILEAWSYIYTGLQPAIEVSGHELTVRYQSLIAGNSVAKQYDDQAQATIQVCLGVNLVKSGFPEINDSTQDAIDAAADLAALSVRGW